MQSAAVLLFTVGAAAAAGTGAASLRSAGAQAALLETESHMRARTRAKAMTQAQWRFGSNYVPQHYGNWKFSDGQWNFGNDKRIECEACGYNMYMLIDRLGDEFTEKTVADEMGALCPRVQWVFKSACEYINKKHATQIKTAVMRLTEPEDICKQLGYCAPDFYDAQQMGGMAPQEAAQAETRVVGVGPTTDWQLRSLAMALRFRVASTASIRPQDHTLCPRTLLTHLTTTAGTTRAATQCRIQVSQAHPRLRRQGGRQGRILKRIGDE